MIRYLSLLPLFSLIFILIIPQLVFADVAVNGGHSLCRASLCVNGREIDTSTFPAVILGFFITLILELMIFFAFGHHSKKEIKWITIANLLSYTTLNLITYFLMLYDKANPHPYWVRGSVIQMLTPVIVLILEVGVIIFEYLFLKKVVISKHLLTFVVVANLVSLILGYALLTIILSNVS